MGGGAAPEVARLAGPMTDLYVRSNRRQSRHNAVAVLAEYLRDDVDRLLALGRIASQPIWKRWRAL